MDMLLLQQHQDGICRRLSVIGIPTHSIMPFYELMCKWERCSGVEWTIKRLKSLKVDLIRSQSSLSSLTWIRKNSRGEIYGVIGTLFRWARSSEENFSRCVQAFMAYSFYILPGLSESQKEKFLTAINPPEPDNLTDELLGSFSKMVRQVIRRRAVSVPHRPLVTYRGSPDKRSPRPWSVSVSQAERVLDDVEIFNSPWGIDLYRDHRRLYEPLLVGLLERRTRLNETTNSHIPSGDGWFDYERLPLCGEIHFIQEPGGKLRSVASPFRIHQEALRPLGEEIYDVVKSLPWDCTFDQTKAIPAIQAHLGKGGRVHSIDLSSATDHFPLRLQEVALRAIFFQEDWDHIDLFTKISRGQWRSSLGYLRWSKGQPLGLYPSFGSFTLTHGLLLLWLAGGSYHQQFFVVGDDVVILDDKLKDRYQDMLNLMACPWSTDKSISSSKLSEFAGKIITSSAVYPQLKWRNMSDDNFLDICRLLGSKSRCLLSPRQKVVFDHVAHLCAPVGLNFSLPGDNLEKMIFRTMDFYQPEKTILGSLVGLRKKIHREVYSSSERFDATELESLSVTFDVKVKTVLCQVLKSRWEVLLSIGLEAFDTVPEALGLLPRLPLRSVAPSRVTTLDRYERLLSQKGRC